MNSAVTLPDLMTALELARALKISKQSVYAYTRKKLIPVIQIGRHNRYDYARVLDALNESLPKACPISDAKVSESRSLKIEKTDHGVPKKKGNAHGNL